MKNLVIAIQFNRLRRRNQLEAPFAHPSELVSGPTTNIHHAQGIEGQLHYRIVCFFWGQGRRPQAVSSTTVQQVFTGSLSNSLVQTIVSYCRLWCLSQLVCRSGFLNRTRYNGELVSLVMACRPCPDDQEHIQQSKVIDSIRFECASCKVRLLKFFRRDETLKDWSYWAVDGQNQKLETITKQSKFNQLKLINCNQSINCDLTLILVNNEIILMIIFFLNIKLTHVLMIIDNDIILK